MALPPDRPDFTDLATPSDHKALKRLADMDTATSTPSDDGSQRRGPSGAVLGALVAPGSPSFFRNWLLSAFLLVLGFVIPVATVVVALVRRDEITSLVVTYRRFTSSARFNTWCFRRDSFGGAGRVVSGAS